MMKKTFGLVLFVLMMTGCGGSDDSPAPVAASLVGSWAMESLSVDGETGDVSATSSERMNGGYFEEMSFMQFTFTDSLLTTYVTQNRDTVSDQSRYTFNGSQILVGGETLTVLSLTSESLVISMPGFDASMSLTLSKIPQSQVDQNASLVESQQ